MSIFSSGGRSASARRFSQAASYAANSQIQWPSPATLRRVSMSVKGRRRALDLYGTKDVLFSHEQMKKAQQSSGNTTGDRLFGCVKNINL